MNRTVQAESVITLDWIRESASIAVPVYQRDYRWTVESCRRLLADIIAAANHEDHDATHFIGSILTVGTGNVTLVDGQQRLTTLFLLLLAVRDAARKDDPPLAEDIGRLLYAAGSDGPLRLRSHDDHTSLMRRLATEGASSLTDQEGGSFKENYSDLARMVGSDWRLVWRGLGRLENVVIQLGDHANAQQVFESLNSTGEALVNHELMHNYVLMGLEHEQQREVERDIWSPIDLATGDSTERFWRDYLILTSPRMPDLQGEHGLYRVFRDRFSDLDYGRLLDLGREWVDYAEWYRVILNPELAHDPRVEMQLRFLRDHFAGMSPLVLGLYRDLARERMTVDEFAGIADLIQSMSLRRAFIGLDRDLGMAGVLARALEQGLPALEEEIVKRMPEDKQIALALSYQSLPLAGYVLQRLQGVESLAGIQVEHVYPQTPNPEWSGGGVKWGDMSEDARTELKTVLQTIGNLTLLESHLNQGAGNKSFAIKQRDYYSKSIVPETRDELKGDPDWGKKSIVARTKKLTERFLTVWSRPANIAPTEVVELTRVVDLPKHARRDLFKDQFELVRYGDRELGNVTGVKDLWLLVVEDLWRTQRDKLLQFANVDGGWSTIRDHRPPKEKWHALDGGYFVFWGWAWQYLLDNLQKLLIEFDLQDAVRVKLRDKENDGVEPSQSGLD